MQKPNKLSAHKSQLASQQASLHRRVICSSSWTGIHSSWQLFQWGGDFSNIFPCLKKAPCKEISMSSGRILSQIVTTCHADTDFFLNFPKRTYTHTNFAFDGILTMLSSWHSHQNEERQTPTHICDWHPQYYEFVQLTIQTVHQ